MQVTLGHHICGGLPLQAACCGQPAHSQHRSPQPAASHESVAQPSQQRLLLEQAAAPCLACLGRLRCAHQWLHAGAALQTVACSEPQQAASVRLTPWRQPPAAAPLPLPACPVRTTCSTCSCLKGLCHSDKPEVTVCMIVCMSAKHRISFGLCRLQKEDPVAGRGAAGTSVQAR